MWSICETVLRREFVYKEDGDSSQGLTVESVLERIRSFKIEIFQRVRGILGGDKRRNLEFFGVSLFGGELDGSISLDLVCLVSVKGLSGQRFRR